MALWNERERKNKTFSDFEAALVRLGRDYCRRRWQVCPMREYCGRRGALPATGRRATAHVKNQN